MEDKMTVKKAAKLWGISERQVSDYCYRGEIAGAYKENRMWFLPTDAKKPLDKRIKTGLYMKKKLDRALKLPLPIGNSNYREVSSEYYYVDKTMMIKDIIDERAKVSLFTRPRRFGKTLNMDMLRVFFEKASEDTSVYFYDKKIWQCGENYQEHQGKYPVIFITFKDVKFNTWEETMDNIKDVLFSEYRRHKELLDSEKCDEYEKIYFKKMLDGSVSNTELTKALKYLSQMLHEHYGVAAVIIIDEYDTPIQQGYTADFYDEVILFMRNLFSGGLKDNPHLSFGFLTGILRVAKESIFSGLNNLKVNSILTDRYSEYFGFTSEEVKEMLVYYDAEDKYEEVCEWYDGYRFGNTNIFNPWSVINYFNEEFVATEYWLSTSSNDAIRTILNHAPMEIYDSLKVLLQGKSIEEEVDTAVTYGDLKANPSAIYSFLLVSGYLKVVKKEVAEFNEYLCEIALPNREIYRVYKKEIVEKYYGLPRPIAKALIFKDVDGLQRKLQEFVVQACSSLDTAQETFYHGLFLGLCAAMEKEYILSSNQESGYGRFDIELEPKIAGNPGILIEIKYGKDCTEDELEILSEQALQQIRDKRYDANLVKKGVTTIYKYGVAFSGKKVFVSAEF